MIGVLLIHSASMLLGSWIRLPVRSTLTGFRIPWFVFTETSKPLNASLFSMLTATWTWLPNGAVKEAGASGQDTKDTSAMQTVPVV